MLGSVFGKSFNSGKCKTLLRLAISRIKLLRNKRDMQVKQMRRELGQLLQTKQDLTARIRVEHVFREQNIMAAYEIIELFSELLVVRLPIIESQRQCPIDLREAVASLIFAAPRCADLPELEQISCLFAVKYGKDFVTAAAELRPDCGVNRLVIEKLSVRAPSGEMRLKLMKEIAEEQGVDWDATASEYELQKAPEDLLDSSNKFIGANQVQFHSPSNEQNSRRDVEFHQNRATLDDAQNVPFTLRECQMNAATAPNGQSQMTSNGSFNNHQQAQKSFSPRRNVTFAYDDNKTEFPELGKEETYKDAADAARAAALSAERAAAAAMAVASLAKEKFSRTPPATSTKTKKCMSKLNLGNDEDDEDKPAMAAKNESTKEYFKIRMDSFNAHLTTAKPGSFDGNVTGAQPLFDDYPEEELRCNRPRATVVEDFTTSEEEQSDSTDRSISPPAYRGKFENNTVAQHSSRPSPSDMYGNGYNAQQSIISSPSSLFYGDRAPPQRPPPPRHPPPQFTQDDALGSASHVHPKLPDYDDLSARFEALRSKR